MIDFNDWVKKQRWIESVTYKKTAPHEYIVKYKLPYEDRLIFEDFVKHIRSNGYKEKFYTKENIYYAIDDKKYWTMGEPVDKTIIINRADKDKVYHGRSKNEKYTDDKTLLAKPQKKRKSSRSAEKKYNQVWF